MKIKRNIIYIMLMIIIIFLGIVVRKKSAYFPRIVNLYLGDILWALLIFLGFSFLMEKKGLKIVIFLSLLFCYGIEISQLYHAEWIDAVRSTTLGGLVLGYGFLFSDLVSYTVGILFGALCTILLKRS
ncbi:DUF2809 domain-containing protein [Priestia endophytica]|jgi:hypothetical protein|uniref:ribosomal maturation YjgA family protein n=1 Tax=Priestia endophytica TaxID=135735 RepID=UPI000DCA8CCD|nr:DUF2809 domain-containing protein [Priestia endophytica]MBG9814302.1 membrane protein [Priestia endophytica]RAS87003.1 hypothetical protein A4R27_01315 [Priestia endophytica]